MPKVYRRQIDENTTFIARIEPCPSVRTDRSTVTPWPHVRVSLAEARALAPGGFTERHADEGYGIWASDTHNAVLWFGKGALLFEQFDDATSYKLALLWALEAQEREEE